ncbi:MAG TPA: pyridoxamine 5'-phosphate oxidase family protein [Methanomassiliicoccales archaeon]|nr:pyridoxamine 5'-phosphate oxidase family protein [Methanomassiliicoccales archaeon]
MRKSEREITDLDELDQVIMRAEVCRLGMVDDGEPYIVPMNFGYRRGVFFFHCAQEGRKLDIIRRNPGVCFELESDVRLIGGDRPCQWTSSFRSVIGMGNATVVLDDIGKREGLEAIMDHYAKGPFDFDEHPLSLTAVIRVVVERMSGKRSKH